MSLQRSYAVLSELESLKPEFQRQVQELQKDSARSQQHELDDPYRNSYGSETSSLEWPSISKSPFLSTDVKGVLI